MTCRELVVNSLFNKKIMPSFNKKRAIDFIG